MNSEHRKALRKIAKELDWGLNVAEWQEAIVNLHLNTDHMTDDEFESYCESRGLAFPIPGRPGFWFERPGAPRFKSRARCQAAIDRKRTSP